MHGSLPWRELGVRFADLVRDASKDFNAEWSPDLLAGQWFFTGANDYAVLKSFIEAAERGAALLGCPVDRLSSSCWLDEIKRHGSHYESTLVIGPGMHDEPGEFIELGSIRRVCSASAEYCRYLETRAIAAERQHPATPEDATLSPITTDTLAQRPSKDVPFPRRASWLKDRLKERGWNRNDPARFHGPDPKTVNKILRGAGVREEILEKLANSLSAKGSKVSLLDIPDD